MCVDTGNCTCWLLQHFLRKHMFILHWMWSIVQLLLLNLFYFDLQDSFWKLYRHKLLVYIECLIQAINENGQLSLSGNENDSLWECFIESLKQQQIISGETQHGVQKYSICITLSKPLVIILDDNFYYQSMRHEVYQMVRRSKFPATIYI